MTEPAIYLGAILGTALLVCLGAMLSAWWRERRRRKCERCGRVCGPCRAVEIEGRE